MNLPPILTYVQGCHGRVKPCFGPQDGYYTLLNSPLFALKAHFIFALIVGVLAFLYFQRKKYKQQLSLILCVGISLIISFLVLLVAVWLFPQVIVY